MRIQSLLEYCAPQEKKDGSTHPKSKMMYIDFLMVILFLFCKCNSIPPNITYPYQKKAAAIHHSPKRLKHYKRENSKTPFLNYFLQTSSIHQSTFDIKSYMLEQRFLSIFIFKYFRNLQVFFFYQQVY